MTKSQNPSPARSISASEIARNVKSFETWCRYNGCTQVAFSDLPPKYSSDAHAVFDLRGKLPEAFVDESSPIYKSLQATVPRLLSFLMKAKSERPYLFSKALSPDLTEDLIEELSCVYSAWKKLSQMKVSKERWSEADYAANVYNILRSSALKASSYRTQSSIHLPRHHSSQKPTAASQKILSTRNVVPDGSLFIPSDLISKLSSTRKSPYNVINDHSSTKISCGLDGENTFRYQATPTSRPQPTPCFEFAGAFVEDKKPGSDVANLDHAYRQNRMACTAALRQLHALRVSAPVFGILWADGKVKAHMDWYSSKIDKQPTILSAMYEESVKEESTDETQSPSPSAASSLASQASSKTESTDDDGPTAINREWDLSTPSDILSVFIILRNLDSWITTAFKGRVERGVRTFSRAVAKDGEVYVPWRHEDNALRSKKGGMPLRESTNKQRASLASVTTTTTQSTLILR